MRQAVYERARSALARQLTGIDPPLSADEIELQHQHLEDAISEVEREMAAEDAAWEAPPESAEPPSPEPVDVASQAPPEVPPAAPVPDLTARQNAADEPLAPPEEEPEPEAAAEHEPTHSSRAPMMVMLVLVALVVVGAAALAYTRWDAIETAYGELSEQVFGSEPAELAGGPAEPPEQSVAEAPADTPAEPPEAVSPAQPKSSDRLLSETVPDDRSTPSQQDGRADGGQEQAALGEPGTTGTATPSTRSGEPDIPAFDRPAAPDRAGADESASSGAQRAIFYEQGEENSSGKASLGAVSWERVETPQQPSAIVARIDLPEHNAVVNVTFTSNADPALPASHLIEIAVEAEGGLGPGTIQRVPAVVLKPSEQARGQALSGAAVPVTERLFWIALSDDPDQIGRNLSLLRDGSWFDMPIMYENGERALLTFQKGIPGDRVFETVLAEWADARQQSQR